MAISINEVESMARKVIENDIHPGEQAGGSGHLADVGYTIDHLEWKEGTEKTEVRVFFTVSIITEFTIMPDNPPYDYRYKKDFYLTSKKDISDVKEKEPYLISELPENISWPIIQLEISRNLEKILNKIEWKYGENSALFKFSHAYRIETGPAGETAYYCIIDTGIADKEPLVISSNKPYDLIEKINSKFAQFNLDIT